MTAIDHYRQLEGGTIEAVELITDCGLEYPAMLVRLPGGARVQVDVLQDTEGNGPGHLGITPMRPTDATPGCRRCDSPLDPRGYCTDETCPHSDYLQHETWTEG